MRESKTNKESRAGFSRRAFLKGSGAAAAATALQERAAHAQDDSTEIVRGTKTIKVQVNGTPHEIAVEPRTTLLEMLRYQLDLTGAKPVSDDASSGASTVLLEGKPVEATTVLAITCDGKKVQTVESLGGDNPDPVPRAFVKHDAEQCGFCTPGFVMATRAFLNAHPNATEQQIREGLNGNICRCGTYVNVVKAALEAAKGGANG